MQFTFTEPMNINSITFPESTKVNVIINAELIYSTTDIADSYSNLDYIYYIKQEHSMRNVSLNSHDYTNGIFLQGVNFLEDLKTYQKNLYDLNTNDTFVLNPYAIFIQDAPQGTLLEVVVNNQTLQYVVMQTGDLNIDFQEELKDSSEDIKPIISVARFIGEIKTWEQNRLIINNIITTENGLGLQKINSSYKWVEANGETYPVDLYADLNRTIKVTTKEEAKYILVYKPITINGDVKVSTQLATTYNLGN